MSRIVALIGGAARPITRIVLVQGGVAARTFTRVQAIVGGQPKTVYAPSTPSPPPPPSFMASVSPGAVQGSVNSSGGGSRTIFTGTATCSVTGGTAPYTYQWMTRSTDGAVAWSIANPTAASTNFKAANVHTDQDTMAVFYCVVTDSTGASVTSGNVNAEAMNNGTQ